MPELCFPTLPIFNPHQLKSIPFSVREARVKCSNCLAKQPLLGIIAAMQESIELFQHSKTARKGFLDVGKFVGIVILIIIVGLLCFGISWVVNNLGETGVQYGKTLTDSRDKSTALQCQVNLRTIWQDLRIYSIREGDFPTSLEELAQWKGSYQLLYCPASKGQPYVYIPGQNESMSSENVLVCDPNALHDGRCIVLRLNGQIELLTTQEIQVAITETQAGLE